LAPWFKPAIFALLACSTAVYLATGTASEAIDSLAWLALLLSFELETGHASRFQQERFKALIRAVRLFALCALFVALAGYLREKAWLDAINIILWIAVASLLEFEVRRPATVQLRRRVFTAAAAALYCCLAALVLAWLLRGEWFDAYDAALWLFAFATLEMGIMGFARRS
jgi:hypothetical protein